MVLHRKYLVTVAASFSLAFTVTTRELMRPAFSAVDPPGPRKQPPAASVVTSLFMSQHRFAAPICAAATAQGSSRQTIAKQAAVWGRQMRCLARQDLHRSPLRGAVSSAPVIPRQPH